MDYKSMPSVVYTWPEIATVGLAQHEVEASGRKYTVGRFPFSANGRARTAGDTTGFIKFIADADTDELLGAHMIGPNVSELIQEAVQSFEYRGTSEDIGVVVHAHPTLSESVKEAALGVLGRPIHIEMSPNRVSRPMVAAERGGVFRSLEGAVTVPPEAVAPA